ncbi:hypothetical protein V2J94_41460 [Streptomyces sp. DSM 41524]|uniref:Uncharacterized protein n=1 Tax=Streptomyces asiaticus subsp. ignotus TaxID=3098222 RepID=A0ABU7QC81_9ACTN|nr:hypothetical protein [Streptomyces sp. DSM 41524]
MTRRDLTTMEWIRAAAQRISVGSGRLCWLIARRVTSRGAARARAWWTGVKGWLAEAVGLAWLLRLGLLIGAALIARKALLAIGRSLGNAHAPEGLMWVLAVVWLIAAYRVGHPEWQTPAEPEPGTESEQAPAEAEEETAEDDDEPEAGAEQASAGPWEPALPHLRIALARVGTPHAHLAVLAADLGTTPERVREALEKWGIPIEAVRMQGRGTSTGVKGGGAVHPALVLRPEDEAVVAAGQPRNNNNNAQDRPAEKGLRVERIGQSGAIIRDPAEAVSRRHAV